MAAGRSSGCFAVDSGISRSDAEGWDDHPAGRLWLRQLPVGRKIWRGAVSVRPAIRLRLSQAGSECDGISAEPKYPRPPRYLEFCAPERIWPTALLLLVPVDRQGLVQRPAICGSRPERLGGSKRHPALISFHRIERHL